jgi:exodeoxyribonuclease III
VKVLTLNVNGIRSAARKGLAAVLAQEAADLVCLQEVRAGTAQWPAEMLAPGLGEPFFHVGERPGYAGVAIYARVRPERVVSGLGWSDFDAEGRYLQLDFGALSVVSLYLPSGSSGPIRQAAKFDFMARFTPVLHAMREGGRRWILCGDWNIAHTRQDIENWRGNQKNSGFLPEERAWLDRVLGEIGFVDAYRTLCPDARGEGYTWWSNRGQARAKNVGWRIDYQMITPNLAPALRSARVVREPRLSDHAPLVIEYDCALA